MIMITRRRIVMAGGLALDLLTLGFAGGMAAERVHFDRERAAVLARYDDVAKQWHQFLMRAKPTAELGR